MSDTSDGPVSPGAHADDSENMYCALLTDSELDRIALSVATTTETSINTASRPPIHSPGHGQGGRASASASASVEASSSPAVADVDYMTSHEQALALASLGRNEALYVMPEDDHSTHQVKAVVRRDGSRATRPAVSPDYVPMPPDLGTSAKGGNAAATDAIDASIYDVPLVQDVSGRTGAGSTGNSAESCPLYDVPSAMETSLYAIPSAQDGYEDGAGSGRRSPTVVNGVQGTIMSQTIHESTHQHPDTGDIVHHEVALQAPTQQQQRQPSSHWNTDALMRSPPIPLASGRVDGPATSNATSNATTTLNLREQDRTVTDI